MEISQMPGHWIRRLHQHSTQVFHKGMEAAGHDLTPVQFAAMQALQDHSGIEQAKVAALIGYDRATIGGVIDRLEQKDLLTRVVSPIDRRARLVSLTKAGAALVAELTPIVRALQPDILANLDKAEQAVFLSLLQKAARGETSAD